MNVGNPDFCPEEYLFRKLAENFDYIKNRNVKVALSTSWSEELRKNNYNYTVHWVRKWIADVTKNLRQGIIPEFAQTEELLPMAQEMVFKSDNLHRHTVGAVATAPYSETEQEHILTRIAETAEELKAKTKGSKIRFVREVVTELQMKGFNRSNRSVGIWVKNVLKGRFPSILKQPRMSIIREILAKSFGQKHVDFDQAEKTGERNVKEIMASHGYTDKLVWKKQESEQNAQLSNPEEPSDSYTNTSTDDGSTLKTNSEPMDLRTLLMSEQSVETVVINCNPFMDEQSSPLDMDFNDGDVLKKYEEKKIALQAARKRKRAAEREADEIREQLRLADAKVAVESKKIHFLEEELEELKDYLQDDSNA